jgi:hypothetical protein
MTQGCELTDSFVKAFQQQDFTKAQEILSQCQSAQQALMLKSLSESRRENKGSQEPRVLVVIKRRLKEGKSFEDFYQAWQPPVPCLETNGHQHRYQYFGLPTRVINAQNWQDPSEIISIGLMYGESEQEFVTEMQNRAAGEEQRRDPLNKVVERTGKQNEVFIVMSDDILG